MKKQALIRGYKLKSISRPFEDKDFKYFDWIITMDEDNYKDIISRDTQNKYYTKTKRITEFCNKIQEKEGMEQPIKFYIPSIAPSSLIVYSGKAFSAWKGNLFAGALKMTHLNRIEIDSFGREVEEERLLERLGERIRDILESPEGWLYISTDSGKIMRIRPVQIN